MEVNFFIPMILPTVTQQEHKITVQNGKPHFYEPQELKAARQKIRDHLAGYVPKVPLYGPVGMITKWCYPITRDHKNGEYKDTPPDTDNIVKMLKDEMQRLGFFRNDAQVAYEVVEKFWAEKPGLYVHASELAPYKHPMEDFL